MSQRRLMPAATRLCTALPALQRAGSVARVALLLLALLLPTHGAVAQQRYSFDQHFGSIGFSVSHLGLFTSHGQFRHFIARLVLDTAHPDRTQISVTVMAGSVTMSWQQALDMLRSKDFLDVRQYPEIRFTSTSVSSVTPDHYLIHGMLQLRGVTRPMVLSATLTARQADPVRHEELADFVVTGSLKREAFGMTSDEAFISNGVKLVIKARLELPEAGHAG